MTFFEMKKIICIVFAFVFFSALFVSVKAHSGGTDSNGGHYDHKNGGYHYHHGYPAHSHYDMDDDGDRDCPYNYKKAPTTTTKFEISIPDLDSIKPITPSKTLPTTSTKKDTSSPIFETDFHFVDIFIFLGKIVLAAVFSFMLSGGVSMVSSFVVGLIVQNEEKVWEIVKWIFLVVFVAFFIVTIVADLCGKADILDFFI